MAYFTLELQDSVYVLTMINGDKGNVMDDAWLDELTVHLDAIEADPAANRALVLASNHEKAWSNGIDLDYIRSKGMAYLFDHFVPRLDGFLGRIAWLNLPTVACISGNACGGGALIASACDFRTMRADRGRICFPEIDLKLGLSPAMVECVNTLPNEQARWEMVMTGRALGGEEAAARQIVDRALSAEALLPETLALAAQLASKDRVAYTRLKRLLRPRWAKFAPQAKSAA